MPMTGFAIATCSESFQMAPTRAQEMESRDLRQPQLGSLPASHAE